MSSSLIFSLHVDSIRQMKSRLKKSVDAFRANLEVGVRLREFRNLMRVSQEEFRRIVGFVNRDIMANLETGRTPLRADHALELCSVALLSEKWLATGKGLVRQSMDLFHDPVVRQLPDGISFIDAYQTILGPRYDELLSENQHRFRFTPSGETPFADHLLFETHFKIWTIWVSPYPTAGQLLRGLLDFGNDFCARNAHSASSETEIIALLGEEGLPIGDSRFLEEHRRFFGGSGLSAKASQRSGGDKNNLTTSAEPATSLPMQSTVPKSWKELRADLQAFTAERGGKSQLAEDLKVSRQVVTSWLKKKKANEPSADFTLRLLAWVAARKAKQ